MRLTWKLLIPPVLLALAGGPALAQGPMPNLTPAQRFARLESLHDQVRLLVDFMPRDRDRLRDLEALAHPSPAARLEMQQLRRDIAADRALFRSLAREIGVQREALRLTAAIRANLHGLAKLRQVPNPSPATRQEIGQLRRMTAADEARLRALLGRVTPRTLGLGAPARRTMPSTARVMHVARGRGRR
jgi:hypothetical protein